MSTALIKQLRVASGAPMLDCKKAVVASGDDLELALTWLRKKGLSKAAKLASRVTNAGLVAFRSAGGVGVLVEVNSETDFVARNEQFQQYVAGVADAALFQARELSCSEAVTTRSSIVDAAALAGLGVSYRGAALSAGDAAMELTATVGEKVDLRRATIVQGSVVGGYAHGAVAPGLGLNGSLVALTSSALHDELEVMAKRLAMHVVAARPAYLDAELVGPEALAKEREILAEQMRDSGKPAHILEKVIQGRLAKFAEERALRSQVHVVEDGKVRVDKFLKTSALRLGLQSLDVTAFDLFAVGEDPASEPS